MFELLSDGTTSILTATSIEAALLSKMIWIKRDESSKKKTAATAGR